MRNLLLQDDRSEIDLSFYNSFRDQVNNERWRILKSSDNDFYSKSLDNIQNNSDYWKQIVKGSYNDLEDLAASPNFWKNQGARNILTYFDNNRFEKDIILPQSFRPEFRERENNEKAFKLFPNPNSGSFTLDLNTILEVQQIFISNLNGTSLKEIFMVKDQKTFIFSGYLPGVYIVEVEFKNGKTELSKIVVVD